MHDVTERRHDVDGAMRVVRENWPAGLGELSGNDPVIAAPVFTVPFHGEVVHGLFQGRETDSYVAAHEIAHQTRGQARKVKARRRVDSTAGLKS